MCRSDAKKYAKMCIMNKLKGAVGIFSAALCYDTKRIKSIH